MMSIKDITEYEDADILVLRKPWGLAVESARVTEPDLASMLRSERPETDWHVVHRLDQVVEGLVVFAKNRKAASVLSKDLIDGRMKKVYTAKICGKIPSETGRLENLLVKNPKSKMAEIVPEGTKGAKKAVLEYRKTGEDRLEIRLLTGRYHQIRAQLAHAGMPICGDVRYGGEAAANPAFGRGRIALAATGLSLRHPRTSVALEFQVTGSF